jgi:hypothetical protein
MCLFLNPNMLSRIRSGPRYADQCLACEVSFHILSILSFSLVLYMSKDVRVTSALVFIFHKINFRKILWNKIPGTLR